MKIFTAYIFCLAILLWSCENTSPTGADSADDLTVADRTTSKDLTQKDSIITLLRTMKSTSLDCTADFYWKTIKRGKTSIPPLIEALTDTNATNIYDPCKHGKLNVGEVCHFALNQIVDLPTAVVTGMQFDLIENDCWDFYAYLFDNANKSAYQKMVRDFYSTNKFVYVKFKSHELDACRKQYDIDGRFEREE